MKVSRLLLLMCFVLFFATNVFAANSAEKLAEKFKSVIVEKDLDAALQLYSWDRVESDMEEMMKMQIQDIFFQYGAKDVVLQALDPDRKHVNIVRGYKYSPNVELKGYLKVTHISSEPIPYSTIPYGVNSKGYFISNVIKEKLEGPALNSKQLNFAVWGSVVNGEGFSYDGEVVAIVDGKKQVFKLQGEHGNTRTIYGDGIVEARIRKVSGPGFIELILSEDGKEIYSSPKITSNEEIIYVK